MDFKVGDIVIVKVRGSLRRGVIEKYWIGLMVYDVRVDGILWTFSASDMTLDK